MSKREQRIGAELQRLGLDWTARFCPRSGHIQIDAGPLGVWRGASYIAEETLSGFAPPIVQESVLTALLRAPHGKP